MREKFRFLFVGGLCALADLVILYVLVDFFHVWYLPASIASFIAVSSVGYFGQKYFTFRNDSKNFKKQLTIFFLVSGLGLLLNSISIFFFTSILGIWYLLSSVITKLIVLIWNFTLSKYITFRKIENA